MHYRLLFLLLLLIAQSGCGPAVSRKELGTIVKEVPAFDPYDQKFPLPKLGPDPEDTPSEEAESESADPKNSPPE